MKDYWDLTLKIIYEYYVYGKDNIKEIVGESNSELYKEWLGSFRVDDTVRGSWQCFIEKNYLQDFVNQNVDGSYGIPKELWQGHFKAPFSEKCSRCSITPIWNQLYSFETIIYTPNALLYT